MQSMKLVHPIEFDIDYPNRQRDRASTAVRPLITLPILFVLAALGGPALSATRAGGGLFFIGLASGLLASMHRFAIGLLGVRGWCSNGMCA